jgi:Cu(I)/Ag(I) efflux system membrane protein CusA/SilA
VIGRVVAWSARHARLVALCALVVGVAGWTAQRHLSRDVIPDLADPQVVVLVDWMGHPAGEVAGAVTALVTRALEGIPGTTAVRGTSMTGMAFVEVVFGRAARSSAGRQEIVDRLAALRGRLPATARVEVGPDASSTGWVFQYALVDPGHRLPHREVRRLQDDVIRPRLASIPGVVEVASVGGATPEAFVELRPDELAARGVAFTDVLAAVREVAARPAARWSELAGVVVRTPGGGAERLGELAHLRINDGMPDGLADLDGTLVAVGGIVIAARGADLAELVGRVRAALARAQQELPPGLRLQTVYDRLELARAVDRTLLRALLEEIAVVVIVVLLFLASPRSALSPAVMLALVLLSTFAAMWAFGIPATIVSLGGIAIAIGIAVDAEVVSLDACHRGLSLLGPGASAGECRAVVEEASGAFAPAILTSLLITALTFLPVLGFPGEMGRLLRPLVLTKTAVILAAALATLTIGPVLRRRLLARPARRELDHPLMRGLMALYRPFVHLALSRPLVTLVTAGLAVASCLPLLPRLGGEFLPPISEGDLLFMPTTRAGVDSEVAVVDLRQQDHTIGAFPEVASVFGKMGRADSATDPAPLSMVETTIRLRPPSEWPLRPRVRWYSGWAPAPLRWLLGLLWPEEDRETTGELVEKLDRATRLPGWSNGWTAPARNRVDMMSTGIRTPVGIRIVAADPARREALGERLRGLVLGLPGTRNATSASLSDEIQRVFEPDPAALARFGVDRRLVQATADRTLAGGQVGDLQRDGHRLRLRVVLQGGLRGRADLLRAVTVRGTASPAPVPLALLGHLRTASRPSTLRTERGEAVSYVLVDLAEGTDPRRYVTAAEHALAEAERAGQIALRPGERIEWAGQYDLLSAGERRLGLIVPAIVVSMALLLGLLFGSLTEALIVLAAVPFALVGSIWMLHLLGYPLSAPVWAGLLLVVGLAMQTAVVMVVYIDAAFFRRVREGRLESRADIVAAHAEGSVERLRPKVMTVVTMTASLLPLLWSRGAGADVMRRIAAPMIGGLCTSAVLTLEVLPVLYTIWRARQLRRADQLGVPIAEIVGAGPSWARPAPPSEVAARSTQN